MFCPVCKAEYRPGFTLCSSCNEPLAEALPAESVAREQPAALHWLAYLLPIVGSALLLVVIVSPGSLQKPYVGVPLLILIAISNVGSFWMLYQVVRYEQQVFKYFLLSAVPLQSFWYLMGRYRPGRRPVALKVPRPDSKVTQLSPLLAWLVTMVVCYGFVAAPIVFPSMLGNRYLAAVAVLLAAISDIGMLWMLYRSIRHEEHPLRCCLLALVPFSSIWYAISRYRTLGRSMAYMD